jgi:rhodanese-related sulfurtransferase
MTFMWIIALFFFLGWDAAWWLLGVKPLLPWQLRKRRRAGGPAPVLLDVRTPWEFNRFHLPGAQNVPELLTDRAPKPPLDPGQEAVVICLTGHRSPLAAYALKKQGYPQVYNLTGGMLGWKLYEWLTPGRGRS